MVVAAKSAKKCWLGANLEHDKLATAPFFPRISKLFSRRGAELQKICHKCHSLEYSITTQRKKKPTSVSSLFWVFHFDTFSTNISQVKKS